MKAHKITCENKHVFYISISMPLNVAQWFVKYPVMCCPICRTEETRINPDYVEVGEW